MNTDRIFAEQIANEYAPKDTARIVALRKLDRHAKRPALVFAYAFGIAMSLVLGVGMCLAMQVIGDGSALTMGVGIAVGQSELPAYRSIISSTGSCWKKGSGNMRPTSSGSPVK